jgi:hypothetical protein
MKSWKATKLLAIFLLVGIVVFQLSKEQAPPLMVNPSKSPEIVKPRVDELPRLGDFPSAGIGGLSDLEGVIWLANLSSLGPDPTQPDVLNHLEQRLVSHPSLDRLRLLTLHSTIGAGEKAPEPCHKVVVGSAEELKELHQTLISILPEGFEQMPSLGIVVDGQGQIRGAFDLDRAEERERALFAMDRLLLELPEHLCFVPEAEQPDWLEERASRQSVDWGNRSTFHNFSFQDRLWESGISFKHRCTDNSGFHFKGVHYDHGNGLASADVDGDGLPDVLFTNQVGNNSLWRNLGDGRFENITEISGIGLPKKTCVSASFADFDNDGDPDIYVTVVRDGNVLFTNQGNGRFLDRSEELGVSCTAHSSGSTWFDYNGDGWLDLFVSNIGEYTHEDKVKVINDRTTLTSDNENYSVYEGRAKAFSGHLDAQLSERSVLYENLAGKGFRDVTKTLGLMDDSWSGDAIVIDGNADGWPDLYVLNMQGDDQYFENQSGTGFRNLSQEKFKSTPWGSMGAAVLDFDRDQDLDLYITDMHSDMSRLIGPFEEQKKSDMQWKPEFLANERPSIFGNAFYRNDGTGPLIEVSDLLGLENYWPWGPTAADFNADGYMDLFVAASMNYRFRYGVNSLFLNINGESFSSAEFVLGVEPRLGGRTIGPWFVYDTDRERHPFFKDLEGEFLVWGALGSRAGLALDLEGDGDLDLITAEFNSEPQVLISNLSEKKPSLNFVKVKLVGTKSNRDGLGALVTVHSESGPQVQLHNGKSGYLSQSSMPLYFGLGEDTSIISIEVQWPSGLKQKLENGLGTNSLVTMVEPEA